VGIGIGGLPHAPLDLGHSDEGVQEVLGRHPGQVPIFERVVDLSKVGRHFVPGAQLALGVDLGLLQRLAGRVLALLPADLLVGPVLGRCPLDDLEGQAPLGQPLQNAADLVRGHGRSQVPGTVVLLGADAQHEDIALQSQGHARLGRLPERQVDLTFPQLLDRAVPELL